MQIPAQFIHSPVPLKAALSQSLPRAAADDQFHDTVADTVEDFAHHGKKLGTLAAVSWATATLPLAALTAGINVIPGALFGAVGIGLMIGILPLAAWEEKHLGIGKKVGELAGTALGAGVGLAKAGVAELIGQAQTPERVVLHRQHPGQATPFRPLAQKAVDSALGPIKERTKAVEIGELVGATASTLAMAYTIPGLIGAAIGGPVGAVLATTLIGPLSGMVVGGLVESTLGAMPMNLRDPSFSTDILKMRRR